MRNKLDPITLLNKRHEISRARVVSNPILPEASLRLVWCRDAARLAGDIVEGKRLERFQHPVSNAGGFRLPDGQAGESLGVCLLQQGPPFTADIHQSRRVEHASARVARYVELAVIEGGR